MELRDIFTVGRVTDFWNVLREVDPQGAIREAQQPVRLVICGAPGVGKRALAAGLSQGGGPDDPVLDVCDMPEDVAVALPNADLYLYVAAAHDRLGIVQRNHVQQLTRRSGAVVCVLNDRLGTATGDGALIGDLAGASLGVAADRVLTASVTDRRALGQDFALGLLRVAPHLALPLGRRLPVFREAAAQVLIAETARVNAEFAIISSLPAIIPVVGTIGAAGADMLVLTKNQVLLLLKLAMLYQRPIDNRLQVLAEVAPVIGAAFFWRSAARMLISFVPGPLAMAPRGAVAFVGTYVAGKAGQYYYQWGQRPSPEVLDHFRNEALEQIGAMAPLLARVTRYLRFS